MQTKNLNTLYEMNCFHVHMLTSMSCQLKDESVLKCAVCMSAFIPYCLFPRRKKKLFFFIIDAILAIKCATSSMQPKGLCSIHVHYILVILCKVRQNLWKNRKASVKRLSKYQLQCTLWEFNYTLLPICPEQQANTSLYLAHSQREWKTQAILWFHS